MAVEPYFISVRFAIMVTFTHAWIVGEDDRHGSVRLSRAAILLDDVSDGLRSKCAPMRRFGERVIHGVSETRMVLHPPNSGVDMSLVVVHSRAAEVLALGRRTTRNEELVARTA